ncbi:uncharacterized protein [Rutidosis leptorrhynchoides]|uniref:uncharacterized protein n=1 Tax=Rutidosis leptorrhynchoides TaxID=125765 RepID=UPI003A98DF0F
MRKDSDSWQWNLQSNGFFSTSTLTTLIDERLVVQNNSNRVDTVRNNMLPQKIGIFVWRTKLSRIPVRVELDKRGIDLDLVRCPICDRDIETVEHIMLHCPFAKDIWSRVFRWWNIGVPNYTNLGDIFQGKHGSGSLSKLWQAIKWISGYIIWQKRNQTLFRNKKGNGPTTLKGIHIKTYEWVKHRSKKTSIDWIQWLLNPKSFDDHG